MKSRLVPATVVAVSLVAFAVVALLAKIQNDIDSTFYRYKSAMGLSIQDVEKRFGGPYAKFQAHDPGFPMKGYAVPETKQFSLAMVYLGKHGTIVYLFFGDDGRVVGTEYVGG
jgi:hypothetical protein